MPANEPPFLSVADVVRLHARAIARYGGSPGRREEGLLIRAVATPTQSFKGVSLHPTLAAMSGATLFPRCRNHPFSEGVSLQEVLMIRVRFAFTRQCAWGRSLAVIGVDAQGARVPHVVQDREIEAFLQAHALTMSQLRGAQVQLPRERP